MLLISLCRFRIGCHEVCSGLQSNSWRVKLQSFQSFTAHLGPGKRAGVPHDAHTTTQMLAQALAVLTTHGVGPELRKAAVAVAQTIHLFQPVAVVRAVHDISGPGTGQTDLMRVCCSTVFFLVLHSTLHLHACIQSTLQVALQSGRRQCRSSGIVCSVHSASTTWQCCLPCRKHRPLNQNSFFQRLHGFCSVSARQFRTSRTKSMPFGTPPHKTPPSPAASMHITPLPPPLRLHKSPTQPRHARRCGTSTTAAT